MSYEYIYELLLAVYELLLWRLKSVNEWITWLQAFKERAISDFPQLNKKLPLLYIGLLVFDDKLTSLLYIN